jgi:hypothetical protein
MHTASVAVKQDFTTDDGVFTGEDQALRFTIYDDTTGAAKDITGWTIEFKLASSQTSAALVTKSATLTTPASGICTVTLSAADLAAAVGIYFYSLTRTDAGNVQVLAYGAFVVQGRPS